MDGEGVGAHGRLPCRAIPRDSEPIQGSQKPADCIRGWILSPAFLYSECHVIPPSSAVARPRQARLRSIIRNLARHGCPALNIRSEL